MIEGEAANNTTLETGALHEIALTAAPETDKEAGTVTTGIDKGAETAMIKVADLAGTVIKAEETAATEGMIVTEEITATEETTVIAGMIAGVEMIATNAIANTAEIDETTVFNVGANSVEIGAMTATAAARATTAATTEGMTATLVRGDEIKAIALQILTLRQASRSSAHC